MNRPFLFAVLVALPFLVASSRAESRVLRTGDLDVDLSIEPDPPQTGENQLLVTLADSAGSPVDGATLAFIWDMPTMGTMPEMKGNGLVKAPGHGRYVVTFPLSMDGDWYLTLSIDAPRRAHQELKMKVATGRPGLTVEHAGAESGNALDVSLERQQLIGVTFEVVQRRPLAVTVRATGHVETARTRGRGASRHRDAGGRLWLRANVMERDANLVAVGQHARLSLPALSEAIEARVISVAPAVDDKTRTIDVGLELVNPRAPIKPGMSADVVIEAPLGRRLAVPDSALLMSGAHRYTFVDRGGGRLAPVEVEVGTLAGDYDEVRAGLSAGDRVATGATFLLSSEAKLRDALPRWSTP